MLLAEALAAKKDALKEVEDLRERLAAAAVRYEDQEASEDPADLVAKLDDALDRVESLTVRINRTNNATRLGFDGRDLSIMEAVALRDRLVMEARIRRGVVDAIDVGLEVRPSRQPQYYAAPERRSKDDIRKIVAVDYKAARSAADDVSERVRRLDIALQQQNWSVELLD
jgi:hypothetical protein